LPSPLTPVAISRAAEAMASASVLLDMIVYGRQETWGGLTSGLSSDVLNQRQSVPRLRPAHRPMVAARRQPSDELGTACDGDDPAGSVSGNEQLDSPSLATSLLGYI
jgi:hypothetical protein